MSNLGEFGPFEIRDEFERNMARAQAAADEAHDELLRDLFGDDSEMIDRLARVAARIRGPRLRYVEGHELLADVVDFRDPFEGKNRGPA